MCRFISYGDDDRYEWLRSDPRGLFDCGPIELHPTDEEVEDEPEIEHRKNNTDNKERGHVVPVANL